MFQLKHTIVSEEILENDFVCNLNACKGACCVEGEAGAPLDEEETKTLEKLYPAIKPFLREEGIKAIEEQGTWVTGLDGEPETPLVNGSECAYVVFNDSGIAKCGIEEAYNADKISFKKPISCHLYPVRIKKYASFAAVNYHQWHICNDACTLGTSLQVPIYKFVKEALIRKFGEDWYNQLEQVAKELKKNE